MPFPNPADDDDEFAQPMLSVRTSREAAFVALEEFRNSGTWLGDVLDRLFRTASVPPRDRGLATELACGVVRRLATLDAILRKLVARPLDQVEPPLLTVLRLGIYQVILLDGVPPHASVHETVELTKRLGRIRWSGFVNGVLRGATRLVTSEFSQEPSASDVPVSAGRFRRLNAEVFADPKIDPVHYFADAYSFPHWLGERWMNRNGSPMSPAALFRIGAWFNSPGKVLLRANRLRTTRDALLAEFERAGVVASPVEGLDAIQLDGAAQIDQLPGFAEGLFAVQDLSAMQAAIRLAPQPGDCVWDVCAAPGGKTCHLAELMNNTGTIIATDVRPERLRLIEENRERLGADIISPQWIGEDGTGLPDAPFNAILIDVPCSNTGVLGKRPEARWRITASGITELNRVQERLLGDALARLAPNGRAVYSTCSIEPEENSELVARVLSRFPGIRLVEEVNFLPGEPSDGGYQALLVRE